jgi:8-oxo-dGTP diphosphatase
MSRIPTLDQVSAGGVVFRKQGERTQVALISVGDEGRWQLPKGLVNSSEEPETTALREVQEEAGVEAELLDFIDRIEYWYYGTRKGNRIRYHKRVDFYLMRYLSGDVGDHDHEVNEAAWIELVQAQEKLAFKSEKDVVLKAAKMIEEYSKE